MQYYGHEKQVQDFLYVPNRRLEFPWSKWVVALSFNRDNGMITAYLRSGRTRLFLLSPDRGEAMELAYLLATSPNIDVDLQSFLNLSQTEKSDKRLFPDNEWVAVESSNVDAFLHVQEFNQLQVSYHGGRVYVYDGIDLESAVDFYIYHSKGRWTWLHLRLAGRGFSRAPAGAGSPPGGKRRKDPYVYERRQHHKAAGLKKKWRKAYNRRKKARYQKKWGQQP